jgi:hypothetical protein
MTVKDRFGNTGGGRDLFRGRVLVAERDEEVLGMSHELAFAIRLAHARSWFRSLVAAALWGTHRRPHQISPHGSRQDRYFTDPR